MRSLLVFVVAVIAVYWWPTHNIAFHIFPEVATCSSTSSLVLSKEHVAGDGFGTSQWLILLDDFLTILFSFAEHLFTRYAFSVSHLSQPLLSSIDFRLIINIACSVGCRARLEILLSGGGLHRGRKIEGVSDIL
jgi:hypothetical protein